ncbi:BLUF domain-containing protein [Acinetobacter sp. ANC 4910]|uniref:BLUF domain-containing protein n=1 Tax=Acinetobacter sp. ANC 4910 TaxID=2529850 RepID=UPI00103DBE2E|nr:BLUF domain-containing protein [Acinetobacter sp. ANC 4910]TCB34944.1 BLUF domain-containing protein [Acinetobacter sp. ANC 4910]
MYQLCYASQAKLPSETRLQDLRDILSEARDFNVKLKIKGVLCYADGCFFQCLEGEQDSVLSLLNKIKKDQRHYDLSILSQQQIQTDFHFPDWSMKYIGKHSDIHHFFAQLGSSKFNPVLLQQASLQNFLQLLYHIPDQQL